MNPLDVEAAAGVRFDSHHGARCDKSFRVLAESLLPNGTTHLAVDGAPETLCAEPVSRFVQLADDIDHEDMAVVSWCWVCLLTARA